MLNHHIRPVGPLYGRSAAVHSRFSEQTLIPVDVVGADGDRENGSTVVRKSASRLVRRKFEGSTVGAHLCYWGVQEFSIRNLWLEIVRFRPSPPNCCVDYQRFVQKISPTVGKSVSKIDCFLVVVSCSLGGWAIRVLTFLTKGVADEQKTYLTFLCGNV